MDKDIYPMVVQAVVDEGEGGFETLITLMEPDTDFLKQAILVFVLYNLLTICNAVGPSQFWCQ